MGAAQDIIARLKASVKGGSECCYMDHGQEASLVSNGRGDLLVAQSLPARAEIARLGQTWTLMAPTPVAPVAALPTTAAQLSIYNGEAPGNGKSYVLDAVGAIVTTSAAAALSLGIAGMLNEGSVTPPTGTAMTARSTSGRKYGGRAVFVAGATVLDHGWFPLGPSLVDPNTANVMLAVEYDVQGLYIVPPGGMFSIAWIANVVATIVGRPWVRWHEVRLPISA